MEPQRDFAQLQLHFVDPIQWRYELIRPLGLLGEGTATPRAQDTHTHPETVGTLKRRFEQQGMLGLLPATMEVVNAGRRRRVPEAVVVEIARLKGLYSGLGYRELARILFSTWGERIDHKTVKTLWQQSVVPTPTQLPLLDSLSRPERYQVRVQAIKLYTQGWSKVRISRFLHVSRPTVDTWIRRFETEHLAGLEDKSCAPKATPRKVWLPLMSDIYHLQTRHPDAGRFRIWSLLARGDISERTVGRVMALNRLVSDAIPHVSKAAPKKDSAPHPYKATAPHEYWFIDGRKMDFAIEGVKWWSIII